MQKLRYGFPTVTGRGLIETIPEFVHQPFLIVTMEDLWPKIKPEIINAPHEVYFVQTTVQTALEHLVTELSDFSAVVGIGGGQAGKARSQHDEVVGFSTCPTTLHPISLGFDRKNMLLFRQASNLS